MIGIGNTAANNRSRPNRLVSPRGGNDYRQSRDDSGGFRRQRPKSHLDGLINRSPVTESCPSTPDRQVKFRDFNRCPSGTNMLSTDRRSGGRNNANRLAIPEFETFRKFSAPTEDIASMVRKMQEKESAHSKSTEQSPWRRKARSVREAKTGAEVVHGSKKSTSNDMHSSTSPHQSTHGSRYRDYGDTHGSESPGPSERPRILSVPHVHIDSDHVRNRHYSTDSEDEREDKVRDDRIAKRNQDALTPSSDYEDFRIVRKFSVSKGSVVNEGYLCAPTIKQHPRIRYTRSASQLSESSSDYPHFKVAVVGSCYTGKSALIKELVARGIGGINRSIDSGDTLNIPSEMTTSVVLEDEPYRVSFIEADAETNIDFLQCDHFDAFFSVYSVNNRQSFQCASGIIRVLTKSKSARLKPIFLVANKVDLARKLRVTTEEGAAAADLYDCSFVEVSAQLHLNVDDLLVGIVTRVKEFKEAEHGGINLISPASPRKLSQRRLSPSHIFGKLFGKERKNIFADLKAFHKRHT